jgi:hypothetical protein
MEASDYWSLQIGKEFKQARRRLARGPLLVIGGR